MDKPTWGCPGCGGTDIIQHVAMDATRRGRFRELGGSWTFDGDDDVDRDSLDISDEGEFECCDCGEEFSKPARIRREPGVRVALELTGSMTEPGDNGVEQDLDDDLNLRLEFLCADQAQAKQVVETLRLVLSGAVEAARAVR
ncbi:MAG: hypothetical protein JXB32_14830 [Deltaproteobacteria bacterium]|nr:hypothetical protein [Deltaproteobacteria bacterium]